MKEAKRNGKMWHRKKNEILTFDGRPGRRLITQRTQGEGHYGPKQERKPEQNTGNGTPTVTKENDVVSQLEMQFKI